MKDSSRYRWLYLAVVVLFAPALLINLGLLTFIDDEAIRSLVALEMKLSGNLITPTLHGAYYYNKPPLYNWILLAWFELNGQINELYARIPTVLALLAYCGTIFYYFRRHLSVEDAVLVALVFLTCGRILFWDSMLGLIDITFSWVIFTLFMVIYHAFERRAWWSLYLLSYLLMAVGFMLKGLPAIVFQGTTLLAYFIYRRSFRQLFRWEHLVGGALFLALIGSYYYAYHQYNDLQVVFETLFTESSKRTVVNYGWTNTVVHFFTFPFEMVYHFLPWSLLILYYLRRDIRDLVQRHQFVSFLLLCFLANILVYWLSVEVYPRYLLMHAPLIFGTYIYLHRIHQEERSWQYILIDRLLFFLCLLISIGSLAPLFLERTREVPYLYVKCLPISLGLMGLTWLYQCWREQRLLIVAVFLLLFRVGFNYFVLPDRNANDFGDLCRQSSIATAQQFADSDMYVYRETVMQITNSFYLTNTKGEIIPIASDRFPKDAVYIIDPKMYPDLEYEKVGSFRLRHGKIIYHIGKLK